MISSFQKWFFKKKFQPKECLQLSQRQFLSFFPTELPQQTATRIWIDAIQTQKLHASKGITKFAIFRTRNASPGWKPKTFEGQTLESAQEITKNCLQNVSWHNRLSSKEQSILKSCLCISCSHNEPNEIGRWIITFGDWASERRWKCSKFFLTNGIKLISFKV